MPDSIDKYINTIVCGDCLDILRDFPDGCVDLVLTDPPYGLGMRTVSGGTLKNTQTRFMTDMASKHWDDEPMTLEQQGRCIVIGHNQIFFGGNYFQLPPNRCFIVWDKMTYIPTMSQVEYIWTSFDEPARLVKINSNQIDRVHPTQKPIGIMTWLISKYSKPDDLILDPFCGSGTTCVAAKMLGRRYIGIDISPEYCQIARDHLRAVDTGVPVKEARAGQGALFE